MAPSGLYARLCHAFLVNFVFLNAFYSYDVRRWVVTVERADVSTVLSCGLNITDVPYLYLQCFATLPGEK